MNKVFIIILALALCSCKQKKADTLQVDMIMNQQVETVTNDTDVTFKPINDWFFRYSTLWLINPGSNRAVVRFPKVSRLKAVVPPEGMIQVGLSFNPTNGFSVIGVRKPQ